MTSIKVGKYKIETSNEQKILFPKSKITKGELIDYYVEIGSIMLPYCKQHPISMVRFPEGIKGEKFYQKDMPSYFPDWIDHIPIKRSDGKYVTYVVINNRATLVYLANQVVTPHLWLSRVDKLRYPDRMIFDLDPSGKVTFTQIRKTAQKFVKLLDEIGLAPFVMTTGSRGIHVWVPLSRRHDFDEVRDFSKTLCRYLADQQPKILTLEVRKNKRGNRIFLDYLRNAFSATAVAPYAVRPKPGASIATPIEWDELGDATLKPNKYTIKNIFKKLKKDGDPWEGMTKFARSIGPARKKFEQLYL